MQRALALTCQQQLLARTGLAARQGLATAGDYVGEAGQVLDGDKSVMAASQNGHVDVVGLLLARQDVEVNKTAQDVATALIVASQNGHVEVVRLLLTSQDVEVNWTRADSFTGRAACVYV